MEEKVMHVRLDEECRAAKAFVTENNEVAIYYKEAGHYQVMKVRLPNMSRPWKAWIEGDGQIAIKYKLIQKFDK